LSLAAQTLSPESLQEADDLRGKLDSLLTATQVRRRLLTYLLMWSAFQNAEQQLRTKLNDVQEASAAIIEARTCADALRALLVQATHTLQDAEAIPNSYRTLAADIAQALPTAEAQLAALRDLHARSPSTGVSDLMVELDALTAEATPRQRTLEQRWSTWQQFVLERDAATVQLDTLRRPLESMNSKPPVPLADARQDLDVLKVGVVFSYARTWCGRRD
jgi:DNA repair exonuclease SbcCD ATPase subunit